MSESPGASDTDSDDGNASESIGTGSADSDAEDEMYTGTDLELGQATIVYEDPEDGTTRETVDNEQLVYARDHWMVRSGTDDAGNDLMKQVPRARVYRVERNVQQFEEEAQTVRRRVESFATEIGRKLPVDVGEGRRSGGRGRTDDRGSPDEPVRVPVEGPDDGDRE